jgi:hypothetical protein
LVDALISKKRCEEAMGAIELQIEQLKLDNENPRIASAGSQRDVLQELLDDQQEKLGTLAASIVENGLNPMERLLVVREKKGSERFIVLEGNRRLAALMILVNPSLLGGLQLKQSLRKRFESLAKSFDRNTSGAVACYEVPTREEGTEWLHLRHTGENEGAGVVRWSGLAASRFRGRDPALQALEFVRAHGGLTQEEQQKITNNFPITTLDRLLSARAVRKQIGVDVKDRKLVSALPAEEVMKPLRRIVLDLAEERVNVSQLKNKEQQIAYIGSFDSASKPDLKKAAAVRNVDTIDDSEFKAKPTRKKTTGSDPSARKSVIPKNAKINVQDNKVAEIVKELRTLKVDDFPNAAAVLLRVFLELSVDHYMDAHSIATTYKDPKSGGTNEHPLKKKVSEVVEHLVSAKGCNRKDFAAVIRGLSDDNSPLSINLLHLYVHNRFATPKTRDLIAAWNDAQRFFEKIWP